MLYLLYYRRLREKLGQKKIVSTEDLHLILSMPPTHVAREYHHFVLKDLVDLGLMKKINRQKYEFITIQADKLLDNYRSLLW